MAELDVPKPERIGQWLLIVVTSGWVPPMDRALAGEDLAVLGDDRDFDELVTIPAGPFLMGSDETDGQARDEEKPQHELTLPEFKIGRYLVTNAQYRRFVEATGREWWKDGLRPEKANCPAVVITWHDARAYCIWLTEAWREEGKIGPDEEVRLPTEAEWEKAARGTDGRLYPWGDDWDEIKCNTAELGLGSTCVEGMFPEETNAYGCLDMAGNVWEWTLSLWGKEWREPEFKYPYDSQDGREDTQAGDQVLRVLRGGSWLHAQNNARCTYRRRLKPNLCYSENGIRLVVSRTPG